MIRKIITMILFTTSVPMAVFGQDTNSVAHLKTILTSVRDHAHDKWPEARKELQKSLPEAVQGLATHLNTFSPSAGVETKSYCSVAGFSETQSDIEKISDGISI